MLAGVVWELRTDTEARTELVRGGCWALQAGGVGQRNRFDVPVLIGLARR